MRITAIATAFSIALDAAALLTACDKSPTGPSPGSPARRIAPAIRYVEIVGPEIVPPGETAQFSLIAHLTDGSGRDVTNEARWFSEGTEVLAISKGFVRGLERGEALVEARIDESYGSKQVMVMPEGTFRLTGQVSEAEVFDGRVLGAEVEATTGGAARLTTYTDSRGIYRLYGVSGVTSLRVTKEGYQPTLRTVVVAHHQTYDIELPLVRPRENISGRYTLTIAAADQCGVGLGAGHVPEEARVRTYTAAVQQDGAGLVVTLGGARFLMGRSRFEGRVEPGRVTFDLLQRDSEEPAPLVELLPSSRVLVLEGSAAASGSGNRFVGVLSGYFQVFESDDTWPAIAYCRSTSHQFVLSR